MNFCLLFSIKVLETQMTNLMNSYDKEKKRILLRDCGFLFIFFMSITYESEPL